MTGIEHVHMRRLNSMENDINEILAKKRAWRKSDGDRRKKDGSPNDRKEYADVLKRGREIEARLRVGDNKRENEAWMIAVGLLICVLVLFFAGKSHAMTPHQWETLAQLHKDCPDYRKIGDGCGGIVDINMDVIADIESLNEPLAVNGGHVGLYQLSQGVVSEYDKVMDYYYCGSDCTTLKHYELNDMYNSKDAHEVANWYFNIKIPGYLKEYNIPDTITSRIIAWNWGIGHLRKWYRSGSHWNKLPAETRNYIKKYYKEIKADETDD